VLGFPERSKREANEHEERLEVVEERVPELEQALKQDRLYGA
jgi:hypothetical protein